jgi:membrane associated rhomboid family serine protease
MSNQFQTSKKQEIQDVFFAVICPLAFVLLLWIVYFIGKNIPERIVLLGLNPLNFKGLPGIVTSPLIHLDFDHILSNSTSFFVIAFGLCILYRQKAVSIFFFIYLLSGFWGWFLARGGYHIGASGLIYGMYFFVATSAFLKREKKTGAFALLITFLYGAIVWGFFPVFFPGKNISWEIHTTGAVAGIVAAFYFKKDGPQKINLFDDEDDDEDETDETDAYWKCEADNE